MQRRIDAQNAKAPPPPPSTAPIFNLSIGKEVVELFRPVAAAAAVQDPVPPMPVYAGAAAPVYAGAAAPAYAAAAPAYSSTISTHTSYDLDCLTLLQPSRLPGEDMPLAQFCAQYQLSDRILVTLLKHSYSQARTLRFITITELKEMNFRLGDIATLWEVIDAWSVTKPM